MPKKATPSKMRGSPFFGVKVGKVAKVAKVAKVESRSKVESCQSCRFSILGKSKKSGKLPKSKVV